MCETTVVQDAWADGHDLAVHGWIYWIEGRPSPRPSFSRDRAGGYGAGLRPRHRAVIRSHLTRCTVP